MKQHKIPLILGPWFVLLAMSILPLLFDFEYLKPIKHGLSDFDITDYGLQIARRDAAFEMDTRIVVINIGNFELNKLQNVLLTLKSQNPKVIGIHNLIDISEENELNNNLKDLILSFDNIILASEFQLSDDFNDNFLSLIRPTGTLLHKTKSGFTNLLFDKDMESNTVRHFSPKKTVNFVTEYSFAYQIAKMYNPNSVKVLDERDNELERIDYFANPPFYFSIDYEQVIMEEFDDSLFENKIVLIGKAPTIDKTKYIGDMCFSPLADLELGRPFPDMYKLTIQAYIIRMILDEDYFNTINPILLILLTLIVLYINFFLFYIISVRIQVWYEILSNLLFLTQSVTILILVIYLYNKFQFQADLTLTVFALALTIIVFEGYKDFVVPVTNKIINKLLKRGKK